MTKLYKFRLPPTMDLKEKRLNCAVG